MPKFNDDDFEICDWEKEKEILARKYGDLVAEELDYSLNNPCTDKIAYMGTVYKKVVLVRR